MEPMALGSPIGSPSSSSGNQSQYLPPFLLGDAQAMAPHNNHNNTLSPKMGGRYNVSFASPSNANTPQELGYNNNHNPHSQQLNRSTLGTRTLFAASSGLNAANVSVSSPSGNAASASHQAGPPTQGLFDSLRNEQNSQRSHLTLLNNSNYSLNQSCQPSTSQFNESYAPNASMRALCSPLGNVSPLAARAIDFWVTIFGFSPGASSMILQHFTMCGTIVDVVHAPQSGNWMHVRFASRIESDKALNYNLRIIANNVMVGVTRCVDESVLDKENSGTLKSPNIRDATTQRQQSKVRSLAQQSYHQAQLEQEVSPKSSVPQKSSGLVNKAMDMLFGW